MRTKGRYGLKPFQNPPFKFNIVHNCFGAIKWLVFAMFQNVPVFVSVIRSLSFFIDFYKL